MLSRWQMLYIDGFVRKRRNSSALAVELRLSCTNPSIFIPRPQWVYSYMYLSHCFLFFSQCFLSVFSMLSLVFSMFSLVISRCFLSVFPMFSLVFSMFSVVLQVIISVSQLISDVVILSNARFTDSLSTINSFASNDKAMSVSRAEFLTSYVCLPLVC